MHHHGNMVRGVVTECSRPPVAVFKHSTIATAVTCAHRMPIFTHTFLPITHTRASVCRRILEGATPRTEGERGGARLTVSHGSLVMQGQASGFVDNRRCLQTSLQLSQPALGGVVFLEAVVERAVLQLLRNALPESVPCPGRTVASVLNNCGIVCPFRTQTNTFIRRGHLLSSPHPFQFVMVLERSTVTS